MSHEQHSFITPAPAVMGALAIACFGFFAILTGRVGHNAIPLLACWAFGGGILQVAAGIIELKDKNLTGGNVILFFGSFFMFATCASLATKYGLSQAGLPMDGRIEGWLWMAGLIFLVGMTPSYLKAPKVLFTLVVLVDIALVLLVCLDLKLNVDRALFASVCGWLLLISGCLALYLTAAISTNTNFGRTILPMGKPFVS
jgi:succinate-acetate transporter protein